MGGGEGEDPRGGREGRGGGGGGHVHGPLIRRWNGGGEKPIRISGAGEMGRGSPLQRSPWSRERTEGGVSRARRGRGGGAGGEPNSPASWAAARVFPADPLRGGRGPRRRRGRRRLVDATHEPLVLACLEAGKPVLCEKPLAPTPRRASRSSRPRSRSGAGCHGRLHAPLRPRLPADQGRASTPARSARRCSCTARTATRRAARLHLGDAVHELRHARGRRHPLAARRGDRGGHRARPRSTPLARRACATRSSSCSRPRTACSSTSRCSPTPSTATTSAARWSARPAR